MHSVTLPDKCSADGEYLQGAEALRTCEDLQLRVNPSQSLQTVWRDSLQLAKRRQKDAGLVSETEEKRRVVIFFYVV